MNVNVWDVIDELSAIFTSRHRIEPARLADRGVALRDLLDGAATGNAA